MSRWMLQRFRFVAYLWGIETFIASNSSIVVTASFVAYLWGIETFSLGAISHEIRWFVAYLWGIETGLSL